MGCDYSFKTVYWLLYVIDQSIYFLRFFFGGVLFCLFWVQMNVGFWEWSLVPSRSLVLKANQTHSFWYLDFIISQWSETQSCPTLDGSLPGSSIHGIFQASVLEWAAVSFSRGSSQTRDWTWVSCIADRRFTEFFLIVSKVLSQDVQFFRVASLGGSGRRREVWGRRWNGRPARNDLEKAVLSYFPSIRIWSKVLNKDSWDC